MIFNPANAEDYTAEELEHVGKRIAEIRRTSIPFVYNILVAADAEYSHWSDKTELPSVLIKGVEEKDFSPMA